MLANLRKSETCHTKTQQLAAPVQSPVWPILHTLLPHAIGSTCPHAASAQASPPHTSATASGARFGCRPSAVVLHTPSRAPVQPRRRLKLRHSATPCSLTFPPTPCPQSPARIGLAFLRRLGFCAPAGAARLASRPATESTAARFMPAQQCPLSMSSQHMPASSCMLTAREGQEVRVYRWLQSGWLCQAPTNLGVLL